MSKSFLLAVVMVLFHATIVAKAKITKITGTVSYLQNGDTVQLEVTNYPDMPIAAHLYKEYITTVEGHSFSLEFYSEEPFSYLSLHFRNRRSPDIHNYVTSSGGQIHMTDSDKTNTFTGLTAIEWTLQAQVKKILSVQSPVKFRPENLDQYFSAMDEKVERAIRFLQHRKEDLGPRLLEQIKANVLYPVYTNKYLLLRYYGGVKRDSLHLEFEKFYNLYLSHKKVTVEDAHFDDAIKMRSPSFAHYVLRKYLVDSCFFQGTSIDEKKYLNYLRDRFNGAIGERLAVELLLTKSNHVKNNIEPELDRLINGLIDTNYRDLLANFKINRFGNQVKDYTLTATNGEKVRLSDFRGKVVVLDFYYTGCGNCLVLAPVLYQLEKQFLGEEVVFLAISTDRSKAMWLKSVNSRLYSSELSTNLYTSGNSYEDPIINGLNITYYPTLIVLNKNGKMEPNPIDPRVDKGVDLRKKINKLLTQ